VLVCPAFFIASDCHVLKERGQVKARLVIAKPDRTMAAGAMELAKALGDLLEHFTRRAGLTARAPGAQRGDVD